MKRQAGGGDVSSRTSCALEYRYSPLNGAIEPLLVATAKAFATKIGASTDSWAIVSLPLT